MVQLIDMVAGGDYRSISVIGTAKNAGKTVTLNYMVEGAREKGITLGLTSTGRDGERIDLVSNTHKPPIYAYSGTFIATAQKLLEEEQVSAEILEVTDMMTSMGPVVIARVVSSGYVQLAGPDTNREMKAAVDRLLKAGSDMVLVDGALNRLSSASPSVTDAVILSTGAVISRDMGRVVEATAHVAHLFSLEEIKEDGIREKVRQIICSKGVALISRDGRVEMLNVKTALQSGRFISARIDEDTRYVVFGGSLSGTTLKEVAAGLKDKPGVVLVVKDGTRIFVEPREWQYFMKIGVKVKVMDRINLLAVTVNPYSPEGYYFDPEMFLQNMREVLHPIPVFDVVQGG